MYRSDSLRPAIAMIELIFALVIMAIALLSAPLLLRQSIQSSNTAMQQESIAAVASQLTLILTYPWDENTSNASTGYGILDTSGDEELNASHRWLIDRSYNNATPGLSTRPTTKENFTRDTPKSDIDDFDGQTIHVTLYNTKESASLRKNQGEYLKGDKFDMNSTIAYIGDNGSYGSNSITFNTPFVDANGTTNIKSISVVLRDTTKALEHQQSLTLRAFTCNIGDGTLTNIRVGDSTR